ncbi:MAG: hypothetical protein AAFV53_18460 [Myxococcota bacterium]
MNPRLWILALGLAACDTDGAQGDAPTVDLSGDDASDPVDEEEVVADEEEEDAPDVGGDDLGDGELFPDDIDPARDAHRMSIAQIQASMEQVSGGISWQRNATSTYWETYASSLGVPDYQERLQEDRSPGVLFQKFLDDAANYTCAEWVDEATPGFFEDATVDETEPALIRANIDHLRRRIQGHPSEPEAAIIDAYQTIYDRVVLRTDDRKAAWTTVCVALFTHPDFYAY